MSTRTNARTRDSEYKIPILFLIYNRLDLTQRAFDAIREIKPAYLYVACDGPREHIAGDKEKVLQCREIINQVDWPCEVKTFFRERNFGSGAAIFDAISWFFSNVEEGVILEDDCLPCRDFFLFVEEMLKRHTNDMNVSMVAGTNYHSQLMEQKKLAGSYFYSRYMHVWGWGTWASRWLEHVADFERRKQTDDELERFGNAFRNVGIRSPYIRWFWARAMRKRAFNVKPGWEYNWVLSSWKAGRFAIIPKVNLVTNLGHGDVGTRTTSENSYAANMPSFSLAPPYHAPTNMERFDSYDSFFDRRIIVVEWTLRHEIEKIAVKIRALKQRLLRRGSL